MFSLNIFPQIRISTFRVRSSQVSQSEIRKEQVEIREVIVSCWALVHHINRKVEDKEDQKHYSKRFHGLEVEVCTVSKTLRTHG